MQQLKGSKHQGKALGNGLYPRKIKHSLFQVLSADSEFSQVTHIKHTMAQRPQKRDAQKKKK